MASDGIRVGALGSSPLRDLSHALEARAQELETVIAGLDEVIAEQSAERTRVRLALAQAEAVRAQIMEYRRLVRPEVLAGALRRSGELYARMRSLDSRLEGLAERRAGMQSERDQLGQIRPLAVELGADQGARLVTADDPQVVCRRAERQLQRLVAQDHEAISAMIISGPLEDLADVVLAVELIGRRVGQAPALTVTTEVTQCKEVTRRAMARMHRLLFQISPQGLEEEGLVTSVRRAGAGLVGILPGRLRGVVADHGEGFDVGATEARLGRTRSLGLITMRERVENVGGSFEIRSSLGAGTEVRAVFGTS